MAKKVSARRKYLRKPALSVEQILTWAKAHHERTRRWPHAKSGPITESPSECWSNIDSSLHFGLRGMPGASSLSALLDEHFGVQRRMSQSPLTVEMVLAWMREHYQRTGQWPKTISGSVQSASGENWKSIDFALRYGYWGLTRGALTPPLAPAAGLEMTLPTH